MTDNHDLNTPQEGATDWHVPLNENFEAIDVGLEIRDDSSNIDDYTPRAGAKFYATNSGTVYVGDGSDWQKIETTGRNPDVLVLRANLVESHGIEKRDGDGQLRLNSNWSIVAGSTNNDIPAGTTGAVIAGGGGPADTADPNQATRDWATVGGGRDSVVDGKFGVIAGGNSNSLGGEAAVVSGGENNGADGQYAAVGGGKQNDARGEKATISGGSANQTTGTSATVGGGVGNEIGENSAKSVVGGGKNNSISWTTRGVIGGGENNTLESGPDGGGSTIAGGYDNTVEHRECTVGGGTGNHAYGPGATIAGGRNNNAGSDGVVSGGVNNAAGHLGAVPGGEGNWAEMYSLAVGKNCEASEYDSIILGRNATTDYPRTFAWSPNKEEFTTTGSNQFLIDQANVGINTNEPLADLHVRGEAGSQGSGIDTHVAGVENTKDDWTADALGVKIDTAEPGQYNNFLTFLAAEDDYIGSIQGDGSGGITLNTTGADFAEYFPKADPDSEFENGDVLGLTDGELTTEIHDADTALVVTTAPVVQGNSPPDEEADAYESVALVGQVPVRVDGPVTAGECLVAGGDGMAVPQSTADTDAPVVGRALDSADSEDETVETLVGHASTHDADALAATVDRQRERIDEQDDRIEELEGELSALREELSALRSAVDAGGRESGPATAD